MVRRACRCRAFRADERGGAAAAGESVLLALDWWNGNRSVLVDADLRGLIVGLTLATRPAEIYRALIESTAFGMRVIIESFERAGVQVDQVVACGGLPERNPLLMQIYADVCGRAIEVASSSQAPALGAAMFAAVAAGIHPTIVEAAQAMASPPRATYEADPARAATYDVLYREYARLHDLFGRGGDDVMRTLEAIQHAAAAALVGTPVER